jgi:hypothetical protein
MRTRSTGARGIARLLAAPFLIGLSACVSNASGKPDCSVFVTSYMQRCTSETLPKDGLASKSLDVTCSPGEYEPCTFSIRANEDMLGVTVEVSDLRGENAVIPGSSVVVRRAEARAFPVPSGKVIKTECFLPKLKSVDIAKETTQRFWLVVHTAESAAPGAYKGQVTLKRGREAFDKLDLLLNVLPIKLLPPEDISFFMYYGAHLSPTFTRNLQYERKCLADMKAHGMNTTTLYYYPTKRADGSIDVEQDRTSSAVPVIESMKQMQDVGVPSAGRPVPWIGAEFANSQGWETVLAEAKKRNWPELLLYLVDEPVTPEAQKRVVELMTRIDELKKSHPDTKIRTVTAINAVAIGQVGKYYDAWICYASDVSEHMVKHAKKYGKELWCYDCSLAPVDPVMSRYYYGFWAWKCGLKGVSYWAYADISSSYGNKDWSPSQKEVIQPQSFVHPTIEEPVPSVGWEAVREGVDDYRYLTTLRAAIQKAKAAGKASLATEAERVLTEVESAINMSGVTRAYLGPSKLEKVAKEDNQGFIYNRIPPEPAIAPTGYDQMRSKIAQEIIKLSGM